jgi:phage major head subunit gpT-like protein
MEITGSNLQQFFQLVDFEFRNAVTSTPTFWNLVAKKVPSKTEKNVYPWLSETPQIREWLGERIVNNVATRDYSLTNKSFESTIGINKDKLADDTYGFFSDITTSLGKRVAEFPDVQIATALEAGNTTVCWDGQYFFDTDHPVNVEVPATQYSNNLIAAAYNLDLDPKGVFKKVRAAMMKFKREDGQPLGVIGNIIMVPPDWEAAGREAVEAGTISQFAQASQGTGNNVAVAGVTNVFAGNAGVCIVNPFLTKTDAGYMFCTTKGVMPLLYQERQSASFVPRVNPESDNVFLQKRFEWGVDLRAAFGYTFPFLAVRFAAT